MFRSLIRPTFATAADPWGNDDAAMRPDQVLVLRAAIAAANALELRDDDVHASRRTSIAIPDDGRRRRRVAGDATPALTVRVYGTEPQPFITEVYADNNDEQRGRTRPSRSPT